MPAGDGDDILYLMQDAVEGPLVGTVMSNGGLEKAVNNRLIRSKVGDQNVVAMMAEHNAKLGAEPSGHIIFKDGDMPAGDGLYAALRLLEHWKENNSVNWTRWPTTESSVRYQQTQLINGQKPKIEEWESIKKAHETGHRTVVRYSGTEPKLRILVEGAESKYFCEAIENEFRSKLKSL
jgi:phosphoglucosamine mutase